MKAPLTIILLLIFSNAFGQNLEESKYRFAAEVFKSEKYQKKQYERYAKKIEVLGDSAYIFGDKYLEVSVTGEQYLNAFRLGIFNPDVVFGATYKKSKEEIDTLTGKQKLFYNLGRNDSLSICCFEELEALNPNEQTKRFKFWLFRIGSANPTEYYIEFYNEKATIATTIEDFFENAKMTFYYIGTIII